MENKNITDNEIIKITELSPIREKAFFTMIRQSGLNPNTIKQLKIKHLEKIRTETPIPCKIDITQEIEKTKFGRHPSFIGEESIKYLQKYLTKRELTDKEKLTPESLLFITRNKPNQSINTKEVSRTFKKIAHKVRKGNLSQLQLNLLREFFKQKSEEMGHNHVNYLIGETTKEDNNYTPENDEFYRKLYKEMVMDSLEIEPITKSMLRIRDNQIKEIKQNFDYLLTGYHDLQELAKPMIDFYRSHEDGEMTIHLKQRTIDDPLEEAHRIKQEIAEEEKNQPPPKDMTNNQNQIEPKKSQKKPELDEWKTAKETIDTTPRELKEGEQVSIIYGNFKAIETEVKYDKKPTKKTNDSKIRGKLETKEREEIKESSNSEIKESKETNRA